jgi:hypothetical protein
VLHQAASSNDKADLLTVAHGMRSVSTSAGLLAQSLTLKAIYQHLEMIHSDPLDKAEATELADSLKETIQREHEKVRFTQSLLRVASTADAGGNTRDSIAKQLRELADQVQAGDYAGLMQPNRDT